MVAIRLKDGIDYLDDIFAHIAQVWADQNDGKSSVKETFKKRKKDIVSQ